MSSNASTPFGEPCAGSTLCDGQAFEDEHHLMSQKPLANSENAVTPAANDPLPLPPPTDRERREIEIAQGRLVGRRRPARAKVRSRQYGSRSFFSPHADHAGFRARLADALGTASPDFVNASLHQLIQAVSRCDQPEGGSEMELNAALALIECVRPANEIEAALALQMAAVHRLAMEMMGELRRGSSRTANLHCDLSVKLLRAFAAQFEALDRKRRGGRQLVRIEHVTVQAGGRAIVGHLETPTARHPAPKECHNADRGDVPELIPATGDREGDDQKWHTTPCVRRTSCDDCRIWPKPHVVERGPGSGTHASRQR